MPDDLADLTRRAAGFVATSAGKPFDEAAFDALALAIHAFQRRANEPYAQYCASLATPERPAGWREVPAVPQQAFKHAELRAFPAEETVATFHTSGTTGEGPGRHHFASLALYEMAARAGWKNAGLPRGGPHWVLIPPPGDAPRSSLSHMMGALEPLAGETRWLARQETGALHLDVDGLLAAAGEARGPVLLLGTALAFLHLFERLDGRRLELPLGSLAWETGGYKGSGRLLTKEELYARFEAHLGLPADAVWNEYGMTELSSQAYARGFGRPHECPPWLRGVVIDPATNLPAAPGAVGMLRLFDLANVGSVLAVQTQDLAVAHGGDGGAFELLGRDPAAVPRGCSRAADEQLSQG